MTSSAWPPASRLPSHGIDGCEGITRRVHDRLSRLGRDEPAAAQGEHCHVVFVFEGADRARDHRLGDTHGPSRGADGAEVAHSDEVAQLLDVHAQRA